MTTTAEARGELRFEHVELRRGARIVVADASFVLRPGERWFVLGPNGAGKSTLLDAALGLLAPARGAVRRSGRFAAANAFGPVPQRASLALSLPTTVFEFVTLGLEGLALPRAERGERAARALRTVDLGDLENRSFHALSEGQRQRVMIARALARRPALLVLDEPTAALDPRAADSIWELCATNAGDAASAVLCATHDLRAAQRLATHVALIEPRRDGTGAAALLAGSFAALRASGALARALELGSLLEETPA